MTVKKSKSKQPKNNEPGFTVSENFLIDQFEATKKKGKPERIPSAPEKKVGKLFKKKKVNLLDEGKILHADGTAVEVVVSKKSKKGKVTPENEAHEEVTFKPKKSQKSSEKPAVKKGKKQPKKDDDEELMEDIPGFDAPKQTKKRKHEDENVPAKKFKKGDDKQKKDLTGKELKVERKKKENPSRYDLSIKAKKLWEELRREDTTKDRQLALSAELYGMLKGHAKELVFAHDTARVIECLFEKSSQDIRDALFNELKIHTLNLARSQYAHFYLMKVLRHGNKEQRNFIIDALSGKVVHLMKHKIAAKVVETAYNDWANATQRAQLSQEFYGPEFKVFKDQSITTLAAALEKHPDKKDAFLKFMNQAIEPIIEKGVFNHSLLHRLLSEYLTHCNDSERAEMIQSLRQAAVQVLHTRDGARVAMLCLWFGTQKDRKEIIKSFKGHVSKICQEEHGHMVLMALFDCVDDTKLVGKAIVSEMASNWRDIVVNEHGRKVIMYLLAGRDLTYTHPQVIDILKKGDGNPNSKKDAAVRRKELLQCASPALLEAITHEPQLWLTDNSNCLVSGAILKFCEGAAELSAAFKAVASIVGKQLDEETQQAFNSDKEKVTHWVEQSAIHMTLKKLIQFDKQRAQPPYISQALIDDVEDEVLKGWIGCNRGAFLLVNMLETEKDVIAKAVSERLKDYRKLIQKQKNKGADLLDAKLSNFK